MSDTETADPQAPEAPEQQANDSLDELPEWARKKLEKANREAAGYRAKLREVEPLAAKARELEESQKTQAQKEADARQAAEQRAGQAEVSAIRYEIALEKGLTKSQAKRLVGATREELEADAEELLADLGASPRVDPARPPREVLRPGAAPASGAEAPDMNQRIRKQLRG